MEGPAQRAFRVSGGCDVKLSTLKPAVGMASLSACARLDTAAPRIRGRRLQERRERWQRTRPLCVHCEARGVSRLWTELDHIVPLHKGGRDDDSNLQGLCTPCHQAKTRADLSQGGGGAEAQEFGSGNHSWSRP